MKRYIIFLLTAVIGLSAFSQSPSKSVCLRPAYPLAIGETQDDTIAFSNNGLYMYDIIQDSLPIYEIGYINNQTVNFTEEGHGFYIKADSLHSNNVTYSYETDSFSRGYIDFNATTGRFKYYPTADDYQCFKVIFSATTGSKTITETVRFNLIPQVVPENYAFRSEGVLLDGGNYTLVAENKVDSVFFNNGWRNIYSISLSGKDVIFDNNVQNKLWGISGREDIHDINIYAERLIIRSPLEFPQSEVTIYAKELIFEDQGNTISSINTTPVLLDVRTAGIGNNGANAGNIFVYVKELKANGGKRFILNGGNGQNTNRIGYPGNGGDGGTITSNIEISSYCDYARGSAGLSYDASTTSSDYYGEILGSGKIGHSGQFLLEDSPYKFLHPYYVAPVIRYVTDAYINSFTSNAMQLCKEYSGLIETYLNEGETQDDLGMELSSNLTEFESLLTSLELGLDYFGNPVGWVPLLSFEVMFENYKEEVDRAIPTLYLYYWLTKVDRTLQEWTEAKLMMADQTEKEIQAQRNNLNDIIAEIPILLDKINEIERRITEVNAKIEQIEAHLLAKARKKVKKQKKIKQAAAVCKTIASVAQYCGPYGAAIGSTLNVASDVATKVASASGKLGINADYTRFFPKVDTTAYSISGMLNDVKSSLSNLSWGDLKADAKYLKDAYKSINTTLSPLISTIKSVKSDLLNTSVSDDEVNLVFKSLCAESPEWNALTTDLEKLKKEKEDFTDQLQKIEVLAPQIASAINVGLISLDACRRDVIEDNSKRDLYAMQYLEKMVQRAKSHLIEYHYYLRKAYEYRMLKPYEGEYNLVNMFERFEKLATTFNYESIVDYDNYKSLSSVFSDVVSGIVNEIITEYNYNQPELTANIPVVISKEQLDAINRGEDVSLNFYEMGIFPSDEENIRIVDLNIDYIDTHVVGNVAGTIFMDLFLTHNGISRFRKNGQIYWFDHMSHSTTSPHSWGIRYNALSKVSTPIKQSYASESLLYSILGSQGSGNMMLFSRPSAWGDVILSNDIMSPGGAEVIVDSLVLSLSYDFNRRTKNYRNIDIATNRHLLPYIVCSESDMNGRSNGNGNLNRSYVRSNQNITFSAIEKYGTYHFVNWTDRAGNIVSDKKDLIVKKNTDQFYRANYERSLPMLSVPDTIKIGYDRGIYTVNVLNSGLNDIEMDWYVSDSLSTWVHLEGDTEGFDNGSFTFRYDANESGMNRTDSIKIFAPEATVAEKTVYIVQVDDPTIGIQEVEVSNSNVHVFPNPTRDYVIVEGDGIVSVQVYTISGIKIINYYANGQNRISISLGSHPKGVYMISVKTREGNLSQKVLKI